MKTSFLDFEQPIAELEQKIEELRFVQDDSLARLARLLKPGGEFRFASDIPGYVSWVLARASIRPLQR